MLLGRTDDNQPPSGLAWLSVIPAGANAGKNLCRMFATKPKTSGTCQASSLASNAASVFAPGVFCGGVLCTQSALYYQHHSADRPYGVKYSYIGAIARVWNRDPSNYDALQVTLTARNFHRLSVDTGYTWSKALGFGDNNNDGVGFRCLQSAFAIWAGCGPTVRHRVTLSSVYALPDKKGFKGLLEGWRIITYSNCRRDYPLDPNGYSRFPGNG